MKAAPIKRCNMDDIVLVVEDDDQYRKLLKEVLENFDYQVLTTANGKEAIKVFQEQAPKLVITDIIMPEKEGIETIRELRKLAPDVKIIAISGGGIGSADIYLKIAKTVGADRTIEKPMVIDDLMAAVTALLPKKTTEKCL
jgi:DNA-binding response OmpR family regulator